MGHEPIYFSLTFSNDQLLIAATHYKIQFVCCVLINNFSVLLSLYITA